MTVLTSTSLDQGLNETCEEKGKLTREPSTPYLDDRYYTSSDFYKGDSVLELQSNPPFNSLGS